MQIMDLDNFAETLLERHGIPFRQYESDISEKQLQTIRSRTTDACSNLHKYDQEIGEYVAPFMIRFTVFAPDTDSAVVENFQVLIRSAIQCGYVISKCEFEFKWDRLDGVIGKETETMLEVISAGLEREVDRLFEIPPRKIRTMAVYLGYLIDRLGPVHVKDMLSGVTKNPGQVYAIYQWHVS